MPRILVLYATYNGHTRRVAERIGATLSRGGHEVSVRPVEAPGAATAIATHDAVVLGAAIRFGHHARFVETLVRENLALFCSRPNAFFSVCLSAGGPGARPEAAARYLDEFRSRTGWRPWEATSVAGALLYTRYNPFIRFMIRLIFGITGGDTDTTRDYEYTDWPAVDRFASTFASRLEVATAA